MKVKFMVSMIESQPDIYMDELRKLVFERFGLDISRSTICTMLQREGITRKKLTRVARERNTMKRIAYQYQIAHYDQNQFVFVDETSKDDRTTFRRYGYALHNRRATKRVQFIRNKRYSVLPALNIDGFLAVSIVQDSFTKLSFEKFIVSQVLPSMSPFPFPNSVLVMDNCRIHKNPRILEYAAAAGIRVLYLPPYSPDLMPIEEAFSVYKAWIRRHGDEIRAYCGHPQTILLRGIIECLGNGNTRAKGFFENCGYHTQ